MSDFSAFAKAIFEQKYSHTKPDGSLESWSDIARRVSREVFDGLNELDLSIGYWSKTVEPLKKKAEQYITERKFLPGGRYLYAAGRPFHQTQNCLLLSVEDSREGWAQLMQEATLALMTGAGIGVVYSKLRPRGAIVGKTGGFATGPCSLMQMVNEAGRGIMQGGSRRSAIWAGLHWNHPDIHEFIEMKNWSPAIKAAKAADYNANAPMDGTNISVILDTAFFAAMDDANSADHLLAKNVYWKVVRQMLESAEPGFSVDCGVNEGENLRNACCEITSRDSSDICNLGSINLARIESLDELRDVVRVATAFLLAGTIYSHVPYEKVAEVREKNRRLGLGLIGVHEWLLQRGYTYDPCDELVAWMSVYEAVSNEAAHVYSFDWRISRPVKVRAIAPTGTIGIVAETTTGCEPIFAAAYKRQYLVGDVPNWQYVLDPTAKKLVDSGTSPELIEDAYTLARDPERRVRMQRFLQEYVDHGISSTINLPAWGSAFNGEHSVEAFGNMLLEHLPYLRGITCYPDGCRAGQPLEWVPYLEATEKVGQVFSGERIDVCSLTKGGTCSS